METMKVIDLLLKIANEDKIPEKIKFENYIYWYNKNLKDYENAQVEFRSYLISCRYHKTDFLNEEVEIIEDTPKEDKKIEKFKVIKDNDENNVLLDYDNKKYIISVVDAIMLDKINEIIDKINGGENV